MSYKTFFNRNNHKYNFFYKTPNYNSFSGNQYKVKYNYLHSI